MPVKTQDTYICDSCGRSTQSDGLPDYWRWTSKLKPASVVCPVCRFETAKREYFELKDVVAVLAPPMKAQRVDPEYTPFLITEEEGANTCP